MTDKEINQIAQNLLNAELNKRIIPQITLTHRSPISEIEAYKIQKVLLEKKISAGNKIVAPKLGLTSKPKMEQMQLEHPIYGFVFDYMMIEANSSIDYTDYIHPKVEPEIGIILQEDMRGPGITRSDVLENIAYVVSCIEIIDSRYENYQFDLADVIADNTSASGAIFSRQHVHPNLVDLVNEKVTLTLNGEVVAEGSGKEVVGHPADALVFLINQLGEQGETVKAGETIMTGGLTPAVPLSPGDVIEAKYSTLGNLKINVN